MKTYQDFLEATDKKQFILSAIQDHKASSMYHIASDAEEYDKKKNVTILRYQKLLYTLSGQAVPDNYSANHKVVSGFFNRFVTQQALYLLGNGVTMSDEWKSVPEGTEGSKREIVWDRRPRSQHDDGEYHYEWFIQAKSNAKERLGIDFDAKLQKIGHDALVGGVAFGFWNFDHLETFKLTEFVPLYDEENGALMSGIRFWQVDSDKPLRATLYELDGRTEFIKRSGKDMEELAPKRSYRQITVTSETDGTQIFDGGNYPGFPIVPLWGNPNHQSELVGLREGIDCYDLIKSGFANDLDDASMIYWTLENTGGMKEIDLAKFVERMKTVRAAVVGGSGEGKAEAHTINVPYEAREAMLDRIQHDLYRDAQLLDVDALSASAKTATEINAAYQAMDNKTDQFEFCVLEFLRGIFEIAGITASATFTRSKIINKTEEIQTIMTAAPYLDEEYMTKKILTILGDADQFDEIMERRARDGMSVIE